MVPIASVDNSDVGTAKLTLTPAETATLDTLTVIWTASFGGQPQEFVDVVEIAGDYLFTTAELRALSTGTGGLANPTNYPDSKLVAMRTRVEQALEDACGVAFVPRYGQETYAGSLPPRTHRLRWVTVDDVAITPTPALADLKADYGLLWPTVQVAYEHGYDTPPERMRQAALFLAKYWLMPTAVDDRAITMATDTGTYAMFQAGVRGHEFPSPEVQAAVDQYTIRAMVA